MSEGKPETGPLRPGAAQDVPSPALRLVRHNRTQSEPPPHAPPPDALPPGAPPADSGQPAQTRSFMARQSREPEVVAQLFSQLESVVVQWIEPVAATWLTRGEVARTITDKLIDFLDAESLELDLLDQRNLVTLLINHVLHVGKETVNPTETPDGAAAPESAAPPPTPARGPFAPPAPKGLEPATGASRSAGRSAAPENQRSPFQSAPSFLSAPSRSVMDAKTRMKPIVMERIDVTAASHMDHDMLVDELQEVVAEIRDELDLQLNSTEFNQVLTALVDDMIGFGPLESLLADAAVADIMVNGPKQVYVERGGKLQLTDVAFQDDAHVLNVATRIVSRIGRRVDESNPICDARLPDGSRVNIVGPPLAIDGPSMSIRKFSRSAITLADRAERGNVSREMATVLQVAARARLNILISGGTGSGKTTLLNALSQMIDHGERIVTIEDAAELQLQQPHVVRLETRPANIEGAGEVTIRSLVKNALRMRPDRIIVGEVRGEEALDMLQAMNTGHDGSMATIHANKPRDALTRLENMIGMAGINLPSKAMRTQIASAIDLIVQTSRMRDGVRRVTSITEVIGMEGDVITTQELFSFVFEGEDAHGTLKNNFRSHGVRPFFTDRAEYFGLGDVLLGAI